MKIIYLMKLFQKKKSKKKKNAIFANENSIILELTPYQYKKINGLDFYELVFKKFRT